MGVRFSKSREHFVVGLKLMEDILNRDNVAFENQIAALDLPDSETGKQRLKLFKDTIIHYFQQDFIAWCLFFLAKHFTDESPDFHYEVIDLLFKIEIRKMALAAPRGTSKSTLVTLAYPLFNLLNELEPNIIIISMNTQSANRLLSNIKTELIKNERINYFYGNHKSKEVWNEGEIIWKDSIVTAFGLGTPVRVSKHAQFRPTLAILDDVETRGVFTLVQNKDQEQFQQYRDYIYREVEPALDPKIGKVRYIGTVFSPDAILPYMMKSSNYFSRLWSIIMCDLDGKEYSLWPERFPLEVLYQKRDELFQQGQADVWWSEYMNMPIAKETKMFGDVSTYTDAEFDNLKDQFIYFQAVDLATGQGRDKSASVIIARNQEQYNDIYVVAYFNERIDVDMAIEKSLDQTIKYKPIKTTTQADMIAKSNEKHWRSAALKRQCDINLILTSGYQKKMGAIVGNSKTSKDSKEMRMTSLIPWIKSGKLKIHPSMTELKEQIEGYPHVRWDDLIEALRDAVYNSYPSDKIDASLDEMDNVATSIKSHIARIKALRDENAERAMGNDFLDDYGRWEIDSTDTKELIEA